MMLGPVSNAAHSTPTIGGALFSIGIGVAVLIYAWARYFWADNEQPKPPTGNIIGITLICCVMIFFGVREWIRALKISN
jgi:UDP-N-acetylmuramyl pentapeptide phosphotransferase/UDP-N-acetylglucosamine-1-phosphate transferase